MSYGPLARDAGKWLRISKRQVYRLIATLGEQEVRNVYARVKNKPLLRVREVATILSVSLSTIYQWCHEGKLPFIQLNNTIRILQEDLDTILKEGYK
jgi:excisionase family DNA binding protein